MWRKILAERSKLHTTFLENFLRKTNSLEKNICSYIRNLSEETLDFWQTFPAQLQNCFQLIHRRFSKIFFFEKYIAYCLFLIIQQEDRTCGGNFWYCCQKSTLWFQRNFSRDSVLSLNSILISALEQIIVRTFVTVFQYGW